MVAIIQVKKNEWEEKLVENTFILAFNEDNENHIYVNFPSVEAVNQYINEEGILKLYNDWLDYIGSDTIAEEVECYFIGNVLKDNEQDYTVEFSEVRLWKPEEIKLELIDSWDSHLTYQINENKQSYCVEVQFDNGKFNGKIFKSVGETEEGELEWEELSKGLSLYNFVQKIALTDYEEEFGEVNQPNEEVESAILPNKTKQPVLEKLKVSREIAELLDKQSNDDWSKQYNLISHCKGYSGNGIHCKSIYTEEFKALEKLQPLDYARALIVGYEIVED